MRKGEAGDCGTGEDCLAFSDGLCCVGLAGTSKLLSHGKGSACDWLPPFHHGGTWGDLNEEDGILQSCQF